MSVSRTGSEPRRTGRGRAAFDRLAAGAGLPLLAGALMLAFYAFRAGPYDQRILSIAGAYSILVIGFQFVFGYAGAVSLAQSCFFGLGAYVTGVLTAQYGVDTLLALPLSILAAALLAVVIAVPVLKLDDHYFALATLAVSLLVELIATQWEGVTGGTNGLSGIPPMSFAGVQITNRFSTTLIVWAFVAFAAVIALQFGRGLYGRSFHLMRASRPVASATGLDVARMRFVAFILSAAFGGLAGALMAHVIRVVSPEQLGLPVMVTCLTMTVIGGRMSVGGAIISALLITYLREWFRVLENYTLIAYGGVTLIFLILAPYGLVGAMERLRRHLLPPPVPQPPAPAPLAPAAARLPEDVNLLEVVGISKTFGGVNALDRVSLTLRPGEITGLIGPNGSGKTTLLNIISGLYAADGGSVILADEDVTRLAPHQIARRGVARTFQHIHLVDDMTALDNIALGRAPLQETTIWRTLSAVGNDGLMSARRLAMTAAETLGITADVMSDCGSLAYGTRRRVEVARAIAASPILLLLDEPAAGLNETEQHDLARRIRSIADGGVTVLVVEHNLAFLSALVGKLVCLDNGRVIASGLPDEVRGDARVIEAYLGVPDED